MSFGAPFSPKPGFVRELDPVRIPVMFGLESNLSGKQTALMSGNLRYLLHSRSHSCPGTRSWFHPGLVRVLNFACLSPNTFCPGNDLPRVRDFHAPPNAGHSSARGSQLVLVRESVRVGVRDSILCFNPDSVLTKTRTSILSGKLPAELSGFSILFTFCLTHFCPETKLRFKQEFSQHFQMIVAILSGNLIAGCC